MKKSTGPSKKPATKPSTKPSTKTSTKPSTKPSNKPSTKPDSKPPTKPAPKKNEINNNKPCTKKEEQQNLDKRAFVSAESPKMEKIEIKPKLNMKCIKTVQAHDDWVERALILASGKIITIALDGIIKIWDFSKESKKAIDNVRWTYFRNY